MNMNVKQYTQQVINMFLGILKHGKQLGLKAHLNKTVKLEMKYNRGGINAKRAV